MSDTPRIVYEVKTKVVLELDEQEIGALDAIFGYGADAFLKAFRKEMGAHYVAPYEAGVRSLHERVRKTTSPALAALSEARQKISRALRGEPK